MLLLEQHIISDCNYKTALLLQMHHRALAFEIRARNPNTSSKGESGLVPD